MKALSVKELVFKIKSKLESEFPGLTVEGEISNFSASSSGHYYFSLSDPEAQISVAMFKFDAVKNPQVRSLKNGDKIIAFGDINVYAVKGSFQLVAKRLALKGKGDLKELFDQLKQKLFAEGLFDLERKRALPTSLKRLAIITALNGAALQDFLAILHQKKFSGQVVIVPSLVQGPQAPIELVKAVRKVYERHKTEAFDLLVLARGGGSFEDLHCFNDEGLARLIAEAPMPVVSAIGHEVDYTILDYVADIRAETPTAAAHKIMAVSEEKKQKLKWLVHHLKVSFEKLAMRDWKRLEKLTPDKFLTSLWQRLDRDKRQLERLRLLERSHELTQIYSLHLRLDELMERLKSFASTGLQEFYKKIEQADLMLKALSPHRVLERGYTLLEYQLALQEVEVITSVAELAVLQEKPDFDQNALSLRFYDGKKNLILPSKARS